MGKTVNILKSMKKIPGGLMIIPMFVTAIVNTFAPEFLQIGDPVTAMFTSYGTPVLVGMSLFVIGSQISLKQMPVALKRGGLTCILKVALALAACWAALGFFGLDGFWGVSALALMVAFSSSNPGVYIALVNAYGDEIDEAAYGFYNLIGNPILAIVAISSVSGNVDILAIISIFVPFVAGFLLGGIDPEIRRFLGPGTPILLPFMGFTFGAKINLINAFQAGLSGIVLAVIYLAVNIPLLLAWDRGILKRPGYAGVALGSVAGISVAIPQMIAAILPQYAPYVEAATAQLATVLVLSSLAVPIVTKIVVKKYGDGVPQKI